MSQFSSRWVRCASSACFVVAAAFQVAGCSADAELGEAEALDQVEEEWLYCGRTYSELRVNPGRPLNAVGFLNNGCTAYLIDEDHIVAAAHCFTGAAGSWQSDLRFYPNFHPDRVTDDPTHVPHATVDRAVVGSRAQIGDGRGMDWGIAHLKAWTWTEGLDLTPIALATGSPTVGQSLTNPAYTRHHLPHNDSSAPTWDNMQWDTGNCGWVQPDNGMWAVVMKPAPLYDGMNRDRVSCNTRWSAGFVHRACSVRDVVDDVVWHDCDTTGGSSGSPILWQNAAGSWQALGVTHGSAGQQFNRFSATVPTCTAPEGSPPLNASPSVDRFRHAPRFAGNIAISNSPTNKEATAVFTIDADRDIVTYRTRKGSSPTYSSEFTYWNTLSTPKILGDFNLTRTAACNQPNGKPQVFVAVDEESIWSRVADSNGNWGSWTTFSRPSGVTTVQDLDTAYDSEGRCQLFMVAKSGNAYVRPMTGDTTWGSWSTVATGTFKRVASLRASDGVMWATLVDTAGAIWRTSRASSSWSTPTKLGSVPGLTWADVSMTRDEQGRAFMLAIPTTQDNRLHFVPMYGTTAWSWRHFDTQLWTQDETAPDAPLFRSITAARWSEDTGGTYTPVVMTTDDKGNVYMIEYQRRTTPAGWDLRWKSFYHEFIPD